MNYVRCKWAGCGGTGVSSKVSFPHLVINFVLQVRVAQQTTMICSSQRYAVSNSAS
jgi:hypothetical protein